MSCGDTQTDNTINKEILAKAQTYFKAIQSPISSGNEIENAKVKLGKILYFDKQLSKDGNISCNSCHNLNTFGVDNLATSPGDDGRFGTRNSPTVFNAALHTSQFWDGRAKDVEEQAGGPILNPVEMNIPSKEFLIDRLSKIKEYNVMFIKVFPYDENPLSYENIQKSIGADLIMVDLKLDIKTLVDSLNQERIFILKYCLLEKAVYELGYELNSRPQWAIIPLKGISNIINH